MNKRKRPVLELLGTSKKNDKSLDDTSSPTQRQRLLERLRKSPVTTVEMRHKLNIMAPAARIFELRHHYGHEIRKDMVRDYTPEGFKNRFARYALVRENIDYRSNCDEK